MQTRLAILDDVPVIADLVNRAFVVEQFFKIGDRTSPDGIARMMRDGAFLLAEGDRSLVGCVFVRVTAATGYFGMLSIDPAVQGRGLGRTLVEVAEQYLHDAGCAVVEIHVVNLRAELPPFYQRLGYEVAGELPFPAPELASRPCHFIVMRKGIRAM